MSISRRNNRALNRVLRNSLRAHPNSGEPPPQETAAPAEPAYTLCADIPERYNDSYVRAIPKDPQSSFVYWEMPAAGGDDRSLYADKGTAHVGNDEAVRIGQQLNEKQKQRQAENRGCNDHIDIDIDYKQYHRPYDYNQINTDYGQINWDNGNNRQYHHNADNCQENSHGYRQVNWDNGSNYNFDGGNQQHHHVDSCQEGDYGYHQINWDNGNHYRRKDVYQHLCGLSQNLYDMISADPAVMPDLIRHPYELQEITGQARNDGNSNIIKINECLRRAGNQYDRNDDAAFSEMLSALIDRCNRHIADYRQSGNAPSWRALSSGLLCCASEEPRP
ncbi:hypothetical protein R80B4_00209 [Fibrobacteres bacterium R8-0-B4]